MAEVCSNCGHEYGERCSNCHRMFACGDQTSVPCPLGCGERVEPTLLEQVELLELTAPTDADRELLKPIRAFAERMEHRQN